MSTTTRGNEQGPAAAPTGVRAGARTGPGAQIGRHQRAISNLGLPGWLIYRMQERRLRRKPPSGPVRLISKYARHLLFCRPRSSDMDVFYQIFIEREFACLDDVADPRLIVDCGANVGYASAYFLSRFPRAEAIAVEPDAENFRLLSRNLAAFGRRASPIQAAVWSRPAALKISEATYRDGREWSRQVRACEPGEVGDLTAVDIGGLLRRSGHERISILKMDIEGAEAVVFSENYQEWIDRVDALAVELHDDTSFGDAGAVFSRAIAGRGFAIQRSGELTVCRATSSRRPAR